MGKLQQGLDELGWRAFKGPCQEHEVKECRRVLLGEKRVKHHLYGLECGLPGAYGLQSCQNNRNSKILFFLKKVFFCKSMFFLTGSTFFRVFEALGTLPLILIYVFNYYVILCCVLGLEARFWSQRMHAHTMAASTNQST